MAIDTAAKRLSAMDTGIPIAIPLPRPTGTVNTAARSDSLWLYQGVAAGAAPVASSSGHKITGILKPGRLLTK